MDLSYAWSCDIIIWSYLMCAMSAREAQMLDILVLYVNKPGSETCLGDDSGASPHPSCRETLQRAPSPIPPSFPPSRSAPTCPCTPRDRLRDRLRDHRVTIYINIYINFS